MSELFDVSGKTALVTGGSRGIGLMIARGLVQAGARVIVSSRKERRRRGGGRRAVRSSATARRSPATSRRRRAPRRSRAATTERFPSLDILVNNAGVDVGRAARGVPRRPAGTGSLHTNVEGVFHLTVALLGALRAAAERARTRRA